MTNNTTAIASLLADIIALSNAIDADPNPPTDAESRLILALDMIIDDAHDYSLDDDTYPYAFSRDDLIAIRDDLTDELRS